jgi:Fic family protein
MGRRKTGSYQQIEVLGEDVSAFVPDPLPPRRPVLDLPERRIALLRRAEQALARLDLAGDMVPALDWFLYAFVRKEAVISSQIEGTQASLVDLLAHEAGEERAPIADIEEITNYVAALSYARAELADPKGLPLSVRLLNEAHRHLMRGSRGERKQPGELRRSQNWIGGSRPGNAVFVPPPPGAVPGLLSDLERYFHDRDRLPPLIRAGLAHVQFETIHPYLDGNGRIGRLLIALLLEQWQVLRRPLLYLSLHFKRHRSEYYRRLDAVRTEGDWEGWIDFFLDGIEVIADEGVATIRSLFDIVDRDRARVVGDSSASLSAVRLFELLPRHPIVTVASAQALLAVTRPTAAQAVRVLLNVGVLTEATGRRRDRSFAYQAYIDVLRAGTDLDEPSPIG